MTNHREPTLAEQLRERYDDIKELYDSAKLNENAAQMEKLSKILDGQIKQIKEQELHERETLKRDELRRIGNLLGIMIGKSVKKYVEDKETAVMITEAIVYELDQMIEDKDL